MLEEGRPAIKHFATTSKRGSKWGEVSSIPLLGKSGGAIPQFN